jgi:hypothetical protein
VKLSIGAFVDAFTKVTNPVGVPVPEDLVTDPLTLALASTVIDAGDRGLKLVVVPVKLALAQWARRFVTFTLPNPVARS